jgi:hypothetical protein
METREKKSAFKQEVEIHYVYCEVMVSLNSTLCRGRKKDISMCENHPLSPENAMK